VVEKFRTWSDCDGEIERRFTKDQLLTNIMLYWVPETANSSCRLYYEAVHADKFPPSGSVVRGATGWPSSRGRSSSRPRAWASASSTCSAGHAWSGAATSQPWRSRRGLVEDIRAFFRPLRRAR